MRNNKKDDKLSVNEITTMNHIEKVSNKPVSNADKDAFCVYDHKRHAVGSKIKSSNGSESVCTGKCSWENK